MQFFGKMMNKNIFLINVQETLFLDVFMVLMLQFWHMDKQDQEKLTLWVQEIQ